MRKSNNKIDKRDVFIEGNHVILKALSEEDVLNTNWYGWFNDEKITEYMQKHHFTNTKAKQLDYYKKYIENNPQKLQVGIWDKQDNVMIGVISLSDIDFLNRKCEIAGFIGEKKYHNFKFIIEACRLITKHAFDQLNMHKVYGGTFKKEVALMCCRVLGFKEEGIRRSEIYKNGKYHDVHVIGLLREDFYAKYE